MTLTTSPITVSGTDDSTAPLVTFPPTPDRLRRERSRLSVERFGLVDRMARRGQGNRTWPVDITVGVRLRAIDVRIRAIDTILGVPGAQNAAAAAKEA